MRQLMSQRRFLDAGLQMNPTSVGIPGDSTRLAGRIAKRVDVGIDDHLYVPQPLPFNALRGDARLGSRIVVRQDFAVGVSFASHLFGAVLAESHTMACARAVELDPSGCRV